ncbi:MAG: hypothetical protein IMZ44_06125 [Planctomycetes bacterium]|nr:hypothetical protein [Planctomycetota bacterium]
MINSPKPRLKTTHRHLLIGLLALSAVPVLGAAEIPRTNAAAAAPAATPFTPPLRDAFLAAAEVDLRKTAKVSPEFWPWLAKHREIKTGLLVAKSPAPAVFAENLDLMRQAVGPAWADKYAGLLLAVSLNEKPLDTASQTSPPPAPPEAVKMAAWMEASDTSYLEVMADQADALAKAELPALAAKIPDFWRQVAYACGTYPPMLRQSVPDFVKGLIRRLETPAPKDAKQPWPLFPVAQAPYPLLPWLGRTTSVRECDWMWDYYWKSGLINYGRYSWDYDRKPEVKYKESAWHPSSLPRIKEDGGVCGRLSTMAEGCRVIMGVPAVGVGQPGHRALMVYTYSAKSGRYGCQGMQWVAGVERSSLLPGLGLPLLNGFLPRAAIQVFALASAMNLGLDRYHDGLIAAHLAKAETDPARKKALFAASVQCNPYQPAVWKELADLAGTDPPACAAVLKAMDALVLNPDSAGLGEDTDLPTNTDFSKLPEPAPPKDGVKNYGADFARVVGNVLAGEMFSGIVAAKRDLPAAGEAFQAELKRRAALKIPYGAEVSLALLAKFDMATGKTDEAHRRAEAAIRDADTQKSKKAKAAADAAALAVVQVVTGAMPPKEAAAWVKDQLTQLETSRPRFTVNDGKPAVEPFYAGLHRIFVQTLKRQGGKTGQADAKAAAQVLADKLVAQATEAQQPATPTKGPKD